MVADHAALGERYKAPAELPPKLLALIRKLDAIEGNRPLRYTPPAERRPAGQAERDAS